MQGQRWKWSTALVLLGVVACGDDAMELLGDAMVGVGDSMVAVGDAFVDVGDGMVRDASSDAAAQPPLEGACVEVGRRVQTARNAEGMIVATSETRYFAARFEIERDPSNEGPLRSVLCGYIPEADPAACPSSLTCNDSGDIRGSAAFECVAGTMYFEPRAVVVQCGVTQSTTNAAGEVTRYGGRHTTARLVR